MGRHENKPENDWNGRFFVKRHWLNKDGYDEIGAYFGVDAPLWQVRSSKYEWVFYIRAGSREAALNKVRRQFPNCKV